MRELRDIRQRVTTATERCITDSDTNILEQLADKLANDTISRYFVSTTIQQRLGTFWLLCKEILRNADPLDIILWRDSMNQNKISSAQSVSRLERVRNTTSLITNAILDEPQRDILTISSILLSLILRTEASEFELGKIISFAKKYVPVKSPTEELISIHCKVSKGKSWKCDIRAIRDAVSRSIWDNKSQE